MADDETLRAPDSPPPPKEEPAVGMPLDIRNVALTVIAVLVAVFMLQYLQKVFIPVVLGVLISYVLEPSVNALAKRGLPRMIGAAVMIALLCGGLGFGAYTLSDEALEIVQSMPDAARKLANRARVHRRGSDSALQKVQDAATQIDKAAASAAEPPPAPGQVQRVQVIQPPFNATEYLWSGGIGLLWLAGQFAMVLFLVYFLLVTGDLYKRKVVKIAGPTLGEKKLTVQIMDDINRQIGTFLRVQVLTSAIVAVATALALWWFGVEQYVIWGLLAGIFNSIPYLGPVVVTGGLAVVTFLQFDDLLKTASVCGVALAITSLEGWLLTPVLMSRAAQMNPVAIFVGLLFWSWVWGIWGTILAVPMLMMVKAVCDRIEDLQPVGELLGE
jgi:predicted PurR-regulated permease PerM